MSDKGRIIDGRYRVVAKLGEGGLAKVYKVEQVQLGTTHALKVLRRDGKGIRRRLFREGQLQGKLRHPNIAAVTDVVEVDGMPALVMEFVRGASLEDLIVAEPLTLEQVDHVVRGIIAGVGAAHRNGMIHRDLKPGNVLLEVVDGVLTPKITDFGLAKALDEPTETQAGVMMGTPQYMPPEQIEDASTVDHRADIWSLGVIMYELCTGVRPFEHSSLPDLLRLVLDDVREPVTSRNPHLPARMVQAIEGALVADRDERVPDCTALMALWTGEEVTEKEVGGFSRSVLDRLIERGEGQATGSSDEHLAITPAPGSRGGVAQQTTAEVPAVEPPQAPTSRETVPPQHQIAVVGAGALSLLGGLTALALVAAAVVVVLWWSVGESPGVPEPAPDDKVAEAPRPPRLLSRPRPAPEPRPSSDAEPEPAPVAPVAPSPAPAPAPSAAPVPTPRPAPAPAPPKPAPSSAPATVEVSGGATSVGLVGSDGASYDPGPVPPGRYRVWARFPDEPYSDMQLDLDLKAGQRVVVDCDARLYGCQVGP